MLPGGRTHAFPVALGRTLFLGHFCSEESGDLVKGLPGAGELGD